MNVPTARAAGACKVTATGPASTVVYRDLTYNLAINKEKGAPQDISVTLDSNLTLVNESIPVDAAKGPVTGFDWNASTNTVVLHIAADIDVAQVGFSARPTNTNIADSATTYTSKVTGCGDPSTVVSHVTGDMDYTVSKKGETYPGGDNRTVKYSFNVATKNPNEDTKTFTSWKQQLTDVIPAGVKVTPSPDYNGGKWSSTTNADGSQTWTWTHEGAYGPSWDKLDNSAAGNNIYLTVFYEDKAKFQVGSKPPLNTVKLDTTSKTGADKGSAEASWQSPEITDGTKTTQVSINKYTDGGDPVTINSGEKWSSGTTNHVDASYINTNDDAKLSTMTVQDSNDLHENKDFYLHNNVYRMTIGFNDLLKQGAFPYTFEYTTNANPQWQSYDTQGKTTADDLNITPVEKGSDSGYNWNEFTRIDLERGDFITGWRVVVTPPAGSGIVSGSEIKANFLTVASFRQVNDKNTVGLPVDNTDGAPKITTTNTAQVLGSTDHQTPKDLSAEDAEKVIIRDAVPIMTTVSSPKAITMANGTGNADFGACIANLDPSGVAYKNSKLQVVLPEGIQLDPTKTITPKSGTNAENIAAPEIGKGVTVDSSQFVNNGKQQVVTLTFDELQSLRSPGTAWDGSFCYTIPTTVLPQAFIAAGGQAVDTKSWAWTQDSSTDGLNMTQTWDNRVKDDTFGLSGDRYPNKQIAADTGNGNITAAGGLYMGKQVRATDSEPWSTSTGVKSPSTPDWQVNVLNAFTFDLDDVTIFDRLPYKGDDRGTQFDVVLNGAVTGLPSGATVEYSTDATAVDTGTWTTNPAQATAFRVKTAKLASFANFTLLLPTSVPSGLPFGQHAFNNTQGTAVYDNNGTLSPVSFNSNIAEIHTTSTGAFSVTKSVSGDGAGLVPADQVFSGTYSYPAGDGFAAGEGVW
ncbi:hypothetical protein F8O06_00005, partial [Pseudoclavibacter sp. CFCC 14310]|uniref:hypothetical protein n=1 Tax=Pseudoclavibacter sp. CFCC 14310 TaxID=2615180 RepID=UPI0013019145